MWNPLSVFRRSSKRKLPIESEGKLSGIKAVPVDQLFAPRTIQSVTGSAGQIAMAAGKSWVVYRGASIVADAVASTPRYLRAVGRDKPITVSGLTELMAVPNPHQTWSDLEKILVMHLKLSGNAFLYKSEATKKGDRPKALAPINPAKVRMFPDGGGGLKGYTVEVDGIQVPFDVEEIIRFTLPNPESNILGLGDIQGGKDVVESHLNRRESETQFWRNGASPGAVMILKPGWGGSPDDWDLLKKRFNKAYAGKENTGKIAFLDGDWAYQKLGLTASESQELEQSRWTVEQIALAMGVPLSVIGLQNAANYATAEIDLQRFREYTVLPMLQTLRDTITSDLVAGWNPRAELHYDTSRFVPVARIAESYGPLFDRGVISVNEFRTMAGLGRLEDPQFDQHFVTRNLVPIEMAGVEAAESQLDREAEELRRSLDGSAMNGKRHELEV